MTGTAIFSLSIFGGLICWAALSDLVRFEIPNAIPIAIAGANLVIMLRSPKYIPVGGE